MKAVCVKIVSKASNATVRAVKCPTATEDATRRTTLATPILVLPKPLCVRLWTKRNTAAVVLPLLALTAKGALAWRVKTARREPTAAVPLRARRRTVTVPAAVRGLKCQTARAVADVRTDTFLTGAEAVKSKTRVQTKAVRKRKNAILIPEIV